MDELKNALRQLPADLTDDAIALLQTASDDTASALRQAYPVGDTGNLRGGVRITSRSGTFSTTYKVRSTSPHAHLWEYGTEDRVTRKGWKRGLVKEVRERSKEGLISIAQRNRKRMNQQLIELVRKAGFQVNGAL